MMRGDDKRAWQGLLLLLTLLAMTVYLVEAFATGPWTIPDDARQFLAWTPRLADPQLLRGDLIADYWHSVSPPLYRAIIAVPAAAGILPRVTALLLAVPLLLLTALATWRLCTRFAPSPAVAFTAAALVMAWVVQDDSIFSGTPRAFRLPLALFFYIGLLENRTIAILVPLALFAFLYPAGAVCCFAMLGLSRLKLTPRLGIDFSKRSFVLMGAGAALLAAGMFLFDGNLSRWGPTLRLADLASVPTMAEPYARSTVVAADGHLSLLCGGRMGYLPQYLPCRSHAYGLFAFVNVLLFLPMLIAAIAALRRRKFDDPDQLFAIAIAATLICWTVAVAAAFRLHLPNRYSDFLLRPLELIAIGRVVGGWLVRHWPAARAKWGAGLLGVVLIALFAIPQSNLIRPEDPGGTARIARSPPGTRIAGIGIDLNAIPALTGRSVLVDTEHAIPYQLGYYRPFHARLTDTATSLRSEDPAVLADFIRRRQVDMIALAPEVVSNGTLPEVYHGALPELPENMSGIPVIARAPAFCRTYQGPRLVLFDARCILAWAAHATQAPMGSAAAHSGT